MVDAKRTEWQQRRPCALELLQVCGKRDGAMERVLLDDHFALKQGYQVLCRCDKRLILSGIWKRPLLFWPSARIQMTLN